MKKYGREDQIAMATWAVDCAGRVLPFFESAYPEDGRPRNAVEVCRGWVSTGVFRMAEIRGASLAAHAAARETKENDAACCAARAAGQAEATAHVPSTPSGRRTMPSKPWRQSGQLPENLRKEMMGRFVVRKRGCGVSVTIRKGEGF